MPGTQRITALTQINPTPREILSADRTYYVRGDGNDSNDGLANTSGRAFLTIQHAVDTVASLDVSIYNVTIQLADGTYTNQGTGAIGSVQCKNPVGAGTVTIQGNTGNIDSVTVDGGFYKQVPGNIYMLRYMKLIASASPPLGNYAVSAFNSARIDFEFLNFGGGFLYHVRASDLGYIKANNNYQISGSGTYHGWISRCAEFSYQAGPGGGRVISVVGAIGFTSFVLVTDCGIMSMNNAVWVVSGTSTGKRFDIQLNGVVNTLGGAQSYFPGNASGTTVTGGQYA